MSRWKYTGDPFDIAFRIDARFAEPERDTPLAITVRVANADAFSLQIAQCFYFRGANPKIDMVVPPAGDDVKIRAPRALEERRPRLHVQRDVHGSFSHRLAQPQFFQAKRNQRLALYFVSPQPALGGQTFLAEEIHFVRDHDRNKVQHVVARRRDYQFAVDHLCPSLLYDTRAVKPSQI